ncbi:MAG TPA: hypothetical protein PK239_18425, partial [Chitinophagales bacterium]|nr:hypothetical protein [Chitinophagales bacterium]
FILKKSALISAIRVIRVLIFAGFALLPLCTGLRQTRVTPHRGYHLYCLLGSINTVHIGRI